MNYLGRTDLFFLLTRLLKRRDVDKDWLYDRCLEVQREPDGRLDLWAREHYKSTIITFAKSIQDILDSHSWKQDESGVWKIDSLLGWKREVTIGIFSHSRGIALDFLGQIKEELEDNDTLKRVYPDVLYADPKREAKVWTNENITVKRRSNPKEQTVEAWGVVDRQPTGKHFLIQVYDDVVTEESVNTTDQIKKTTKRWALSLNLGTNPDKGGVVRYIGTRYHFNDTYATMMKREAAIERIYPATADGTADGEPIFLTKEILAMKRRIFGPYVYGCQMLQDPVADRAQGFKTEWLRYYEPTRLLPERFNIYLLCDPAGEKKKDNDYTCISVIGLGEDQNYYLLDGIRDRLNLAERTRWMFKMHRKWRPIDVGYEKYGKDSDIEHIEEKMDEENYHFDIIPLGGTMSKADRIKKLIPVFEQGRFLLPHYLLQVDYQGQGYDFVKVFIEDEYKAFPVSVHDDMLDGVARIRDEQLGAEFPEAISELELLQMASDKVEKYDVLKL